MKFNRSVFLLLFISSSLLFSCGEEKKNDYTFEAEDAAIANCAIEAPTVSETNHYQAVSGGKAVSNITKGSQISFGIKSDKEVDNQEFTMRVSFPLAWSSEYSGPCPTSFVLSDIYYIQVNGKEASYKTGEVISPSEEAISQTYNYYSMAEINFHCDLAEGDNTLSFICVAAGNGQASAFSSVGNFDCLYCSSSALLTSFLPVIDIPAETSFTISINKEKYEVGEEILVSVEPRVNHPKDWVGLFRDGDSIAEGSIYSFYPSEESKKAVDIIGKNPSSSRDLTIAKGYYDICYLADNGFEVLKTISFEVEDPDQEIYMTLNKTSFTRTEEIIVTAKQREGHTKDWIGFYRKTDIVGSIGSLYYYYPDTSISSVNIIGNNPNQSRTDMELISGNYKICFLSDDSYNIIQEIHLVIS